MSNLLDSYDRTLTFVEKMTDQMPEYVRTAAAVEVKAGRKALSRERKKVSADDGL